MYILTKDEIISEAAKIRPGTITRVGYRTFLPVKAALKKQGVEIMKVVNTSVRLGVRYNRIASVIARKAEEGLKETIQRTNNYEWVLENKVCFNTQTGKHYLYAASLNGGHHTYTDYYVKHADGKVEHFTSAEFKNSGIGKEYLIPSYFKGNGNVPEIRNIAFDNIFRIGNVIA